MTGYYEQFSIQIRRVSHEEVGLTRQTMIVKLTIRDPTSFPNNIDKYAMFVC